MQPVSWKPWQLGLMFVLALPLFLALRWEPEPWLRSQLDAQLARVSVPVSYDGLELHGVSAVLSGVRVDIPNQPDPLIVEKITVRPSLAMLWSGAPAAVIDAESAGMHLHARLRQQDGGLEMTRIRAQIDLERLPLSLPVQLQGSAELSGALLIAGGLPQRGELGLQIAGLKAKLAGSTMPLGDYQASLSASDHGAWQWRFRGGAELRLDASGTLSIRGLDARSWRLGGTAMVQAGTNAAPAIGMLLGDAPRQVQLSGTLARPQWRLL